VSYNQKHNQTNGEHNRDGSEDNRSWNCGIEGPTDNIVVESLRNCQIRNLLAVTILSLGVPMILMGDEVRRTQGGNNNAYCHDDETNWFDWTLVEKHADVHRFVTLLNAGRVLQEVEDERKRTSLNKLIGEARLSWHGVKLGNPDWRDDSHSLALYAELLHEGLFVYLIMNAHWEALDFELPALSGGQLWRRWVDTSRDTPEDIVAWHTAPSLSRNEYRVESRSVVVLFADGDSSSQTVRPNRDAG